MIYQYPRYFITTDHGELGYDFIYKLKKPDDDTVKWDILDPNPVNNFNFTASFDRRECEKRVLEGKWREVPYNEVALII